MWWCCALDCSPWERSLPARMSDEQRPDAGGQSDRASSAPAASRVRAGIPIGQSLLEHVVYTYGTDRIPKWRALEQGSEEIATLLDADRLAYLVDTLVR